MLRSQRVAVLAIAVFVIAGVWFRTRGVGIFGTAIPFWVDEAAWALRLAQGVENHGLRPPGFMAVSQAMASLFSWREWPLRFLPWLSGVLAVLLSVPISKHLFRSLAARLLFVAVIAFNPAAINLAREFKPYSVSLLMHETGLLLAVLYWQSRRERWLWLTAAWALGSLLFAQDVIFAYPGVFGALGIAVLRDGPRRHRVLVAAAAVASIALVVAFYVLAWRHLEAGQDSQATRYWGHRYDVFYQGPGSHGLWLLEKQFDLAGLPGLRREGWADRQPLLASFDWGIWALLHLAGLVTLGLQRRLRDAVLLTLPLAALFVFNLLGYWPAGAFRTNLFALLYAAAIAGVALDWPFLSKPVAAICPSVCLVIAPLLAFESDFHATKTVPAVAGTSAMPDAMRRLAALKGFGEVGDQKEPLLLDGSACACFLYYTTLHPGYRRMTAKITADFEPICSRNSRRTLGAARSYLRNGAAQAWILFEDASLESLAPNLTRKGLNVTRDDSFGAADDTLLIRVTERAREARRR
jgi:4-amino-4-deoxy-L-arabinose transferase-like glycosyltransferase